MLHMDAVLALWCMASMAVAYGAVERGRNGIGWFALAVFISPLLALLVLLACPILPIERPERRFAALYGLAISVSGFLLLLWGRNSLINYGMLGMGAVLAGLLIMIAGVAFSRKLARA